MRLYNRTVQLKVLLTEGEDGMIVASIPALPGCWSQGEDRSTALKNIREAAELWLEVQQDRPESIPPRSKFELINL